MCLACPVYVLSVGEKSCVCTFNVNPVLLKVMAKDGCLVFVDEFVADFACPGLLCCCFGSGIFFYVPRSL